MYRKTLVLESLFTKVAGLRACNFIKKKLQHRYFPVGIAKFLRTPFLLNTTSGGFWYFQFEIHQPFFQQPRSISFWKLHQAGIYSIMMHKVSKQQENILQKGIYMTALAGSILQKGKYKCLLQAFIDTIPWVWWKCIIQYFAFVNNYQISSSMRNAGMEFSKHF